MHVFLAFGVGPPVRCFVLMMTLPPLRVFAPAVNGFGCGRKEVRSLWMSGLQQPRGVKSTLW